MSTINSVMNGSELGTLKIVACGATGIISWPKCQRQEQLLKLGARDSTGTVTVLVFNHRLFEPLAEAAKKNQVIKLQGYRKSDRPNTLVVGSETKCSVLASKPHDLSPEQIEQGRVGMYAPMMSIVEAKASPNKTRVSTKGKIVKVFPTDARSKKVLLKDLSGEEETLVTMWHPHNTVAAEVGNEMVLYDARKTNYQGGSLDTSSGTSIEINTITYPPRHVSGSVEAFGFKGEEEIVEILLEGEDEETSFLVADKNILEELKKLQIPTNIDFTLVKDAIVSFSLSDMWE